MWLFGKKKNSKEEKISSDDALQEFSKEKTNYNREFILKLTGESDNIDEFVPTGEFGYEPSNPVMAVSVPESYAYLNKLACINGDDISWTRQGSTSTSFLPLPMDIYLITNSKTGKSMKKIYVYVYAKKMSIKTPEGLKFKY
ncbi:MAG: hypothetical protein LBL13_01715 [Bacteroidales bacterium]|jgi:hypothetical protein|nr:hypothetical protein [Bacteroidales bacterium]